jgi:hypothetical protein
MSTGSAGPGLDGESRPPDPDEVARRLADRFALAGRALRELVAVPSVLTPAGRVLMLASAKRGLLRFPAVRRLAASRQRARAERTVGGRQ